MSIKTRLNAAEKKTGVGTGAKIFMSVTGYENREGGIDHETFWASVGNPKQSDSYFCVSSSDNETRAKFEARVEKECLGIFGSLPRDWKADVPCGQLGVCHWHVEEIGA